jgi:hypothetical protein
MRDSILSLHIVLGTAGLLLGPAWLVARRRGRRARGLATGYQVVVGAVALSAGFLAVTGPGLTWLIPFAVATETLAVTGALARRRKWPGWPTWQPHLLGGSYIALVTGVLIAGTGNPVFWLLPALVGQVPIAVAKRHLHAVATPIAPAAA